jgi:hypothetical protein
MIFLSPVTSIMENRGCFAMTLGSNTYTRECARQEKGVYWDY